MARIEAWKAGIEVAVEGKADVDDRSLCDIGVRRVRVKMEDIVIRECVYIDEGSNVTASA